jgi:hypothetical protein
MTRRLGTLVDHRSSWYTYLSLNGSFTRVSFTFNSLSHMHIWWHGNVLMKREKNWVSWGWNSLGTVTNSRWVIELNVYETIEWNFPLRVGLSSKFYFFLYDMAVLEITKWNSPLRLALLKVGRRDSWCCWAVKFAVIMLCAVRCCLPTGRIVCGIVDFFCK